MSSGGAAAGRDDVDGSGATGGGVTGSGAVGGGAIGAGVAVADVGTGSGRRIGCRNGSSSGMSVG
jgi:hypothetical protein